MANTKVTHSKINFENMDKKGMFVNVVLSTKCRNKKVPYTKLLIDQGKKHEIEDVSWDKNLGLVVSINNKKTYYR